MHGVGSIAPPVGMEYWARSVCMVNDAQSPFVVGDGHQCLGTVANRVNRIIRLYLTA
jgi:hypothetical protein